MRRKTTMLVCAAALVLAGRAATVEAAGPEGTWNWKVMRQNGQEFEYSLTLKVDGEKLTGTLSRGAQGRTSEITNGTFKNGELRFDVVIERGGNTLTSKYQGKVDGDTIKGTRQFLRPDGGEPRTRDWEAKRAAE